MLSKTGFYIATRLNKEYNPKHLYTIDRLYINDYDKEDLYYEFDDKKHFPRFSITGGLTFRFSSKIYYYLGGGYGYRKLLWHVKEFSYETDQIVNSAYVLNESVSSEGPEFETGFILRVNFLTWNIGYSILSFKHSNVTFGMGINF